MIPHEFIRHLPPLSPVAQSLVTTLSNEAADLQRILSQIELDPGLSVRVLRVANSAFYGLSGRIGSVREAALLLGFSSLRSIVLASCLDSIFPSRTAGVIDRGARWRRSFLKALYAQHLAKVLRLDDGLAFTGGLLQEIGLFLLDVTHPRELRQALALTEESRISLVEAEVRLVGIDHYELGAEVLTVWHFPPPIIDIVRQGAATGGVSDDPLVALVQVAENMVGEDEGAPCEVVSGWLGPLCQQTGIPFAGVFASLPERQALNQYVDELLQD